MTLKAVKNNHIGWKRLLLQGKVAVISGAASWHGIGLATARAFAEHGARVAIFDLDLSAAHSAASSLGGGHIGLRCDVTDRAACRAAARMVIDRFGGIDILVNNAGITESLGIMEIGPPNWDRVVELNLQGALHLSQAVIPCMAVHRCGSIACVSSVSALSGDDRFGGAHYAASKAAVLGLARAMARELAPSGIRVNCVSPGLMKGSRAGEALDGETADIVGEIPLNRIGEAADVANVLLFLASDLASYVTGATIDVSGGMSIH